VGVIIIREMVGTSAVRGATPPARPSETASKTVPQHRVGSSRKVDGGRRARRDRRYHVEVKIGFEYEG